MVNQIKLKIYLYLLVSLLLLSNVAFALDEYSPELIWKIGDDEAPPNYTEKAFDEFDCDRPFNSDYYVYRDLCSKFPYEINDGEFTQVNIHYNLTYEEANRNLRLVLDTIYATHGSEMGVISDYNMRISVKPPDRNWTEIGEFNFASSPPYGNGPEERFIAIHNSYLGAGENIILLEDANPKWSWHWLNWDSLKLEALSTPTLTAEPTQLEITKTPSPHSIKLGWTTTITLAVENTGTTEIADIEVSDTIPSEIVLVSGETSKTYLALRPNDSREFQYTLQLNEAGTFNLDPATATYADEEGNYHIAESKTVTIKAIPSTDQPTPAHTTPKSSTEISTASVYFGTTRTTINKGEDAIFTISAVNPIGNPAMTVQLILKPPSGVSVTSSSFAKAGSGIYTCTQAIESGDNVRSIEVHLTGNQIGTHKIASEVYYQFEGSPKSPTRYETLTLVVEQDTHPTAAESEAREIMVPGFGVMVAVMGLLAVYLRRKRR